MAMGAQLTEPDQWSEEEVTAHVGRLHEERDFLLQVPLLNELTDRLVGMGLRRFLDVLVERDADAELARTMFHHSWYSSLLDEYRVRIPHLGQFAGLHQSHLVSEFREFDTAHFQLNAQRVRRRVAERLRAARDAHPDQNEVVRAEAKRKRGHIPCGSWSPRHRTSCSPPARAGRCPRSWSAGSCPHNSCSTWLSSTRQARWNHRTR
ncbi:hypothetical protein AOZ06_04025 [Kibdelosporangium phytohabitans]|uniref:Uncharacterized protein n=2 Tax=Kibdelosporangium phytohabitans TaxID=860235 RepID=A0A0N9HNY0_9PSEU|nr:hypothetical protein AOZ06_04025 [Kibdelosporangium phytohabitans]